jgi:hypothetical protein
MHALTPYRHVWTLDYEFTAPDGNKPVPLCLVARDLKTGELVRHWLDGGAPVSPPFDTGPDNLFVAYYSSAEWGCHLAMGWPMPTRVLDLCVEFKCLTSGLPVPAGRGLLGALVYYGLDGIDAVDKAEMRQLAKRGGEYSEAERMALLDYCQTDVDALARLLPVMLPRIDFPRALLRGRYMVAAARIEWNGIPIDTVTLRLLLANWDRIKYRLIEAVDADYGVFVPTGRRDLDLGSTFGAAVLAEAKAWGVDPHHLADAAHCVWTEERASAAEIVKARRAARKATGLTARRIDLEEDAGRDHSDIPGLDATARELAGIYPELGIGTGYRGEGGEDGTDYAASLWEALRVRDDKSRPKHHPEILCRAAEMVASGDVPDYCGPMSFSTRRWEEYLAGKGIPWPRLESGALALDDDTFREMARAYPAEVGPIRELRHTLSEMRLNKLAVGTDGRNRTLLSAFGSRTGRNQPSNAKFIFGPSTWLRSLIKPAPGRALGYCDWSQQELAIAAALSGDLKMQHAYTSGDFYLTFAKMAGAVPPDATKKTHPETRDQFKTVALGVLYGLSAEGLARKLGVPSCRGRQLLQLHRETFRRYWEWSDNVEIQAILTGRLRTEFGWTVHVGNDVNPRSLRNFPMQGHGAEMLRLACCLATERGIMVCAPVHDALLVEGPADDIEEVIVRTQAVMREASELVLPGFPLRTDAKVVRYPDRYVDERGRRMWQAVRVLLDRIAGIDHEPATHA